MTSHKEGGAQWKNYLKKQLCDICKYFILIEPWEPLKLHKHVRNNPLWGGGKAFCDNRAYGLGLKCMTGEEGWLKMSKLACRHL